MNPPPERTLADKQREIVRAWLKPFADGLSEKARPMGTERLAYETARTRPADPVEDLGADLRRVESENSNNPRRL